MNDIIKGKIYTYCELVKCGKPVAMMALQSRYINYSKEIVEKYELNTYIEELSEGWNTLWIYKDTYMLEIIKALPKQPKTIFEHWVLGKVFGYSEQSIKEFLIANQLLQS